MFFGYGFVIERSFKKGLKIVVINYLIINIFWLLVARINFDQHAVSASLTTSDPILDEYVLATKYLKDKERIPITRVLVVYQGKIFSTFSVQDIISETSSLGSSNSNKLYKRDIDFNLKELENKLKDIKFQRNKIAINDWRDYFNSINDEINYSISDTNELKDLNLKPLSSGDSNSLRTYLMAVNIDTILPLQVRLKRYNNNLIQSSQKCNMLNEIQDDLTFFVGKLIDTGLFELLDEGRRKAYKDKFLEPE